MKVKNVLSLCSIVTFCVFFLIFCGTTAMMITVKRPAEVNLKDYKKIAIGDIVDASGRVSAHAKDVSDGLTSTLFSSGFFEVLDREHLKRVIAEHNLNVSGFIDENTASQFGDLVGTAVLVFGRLQTDKYDEERSEGKPWTDKKGVSHKSYYRKGVYDLSVNVKLTDIQTGRILAVKNLSAGYKASTSADKQTPPEIDKDALYTKCINDILGQFMKLVAPYDVQVKASFETDKLLPEIDQAITQFKIGEWNEGISIMEKATQKTGLEPKIQAKTFYDLGLAQMYGGDPESAIDNFKKAMGLNPASKKYQNAIVQAKAEKEKLDKLKEQVE